MADDMFNGWTGAAGHGIYFSQTTVVQTAPDAILESSQEYIAGAKGALPSSQARIETAIHNQPLSTSANNTNTVHATNVDTAEFSVPTQVHTEGILQNDSSDNATQPLMQTAQSTAESTSRNLSGQENNVIRIDNTARQPRTLVSAVPDAAVSMDPPVDNGRTITVTSNAAPLPEKLQSTIAQTATPQGTGQQNTAQQNNNHTIQDEHGQIITICQSSEPEELATVSTGNNRTAAVETPTMRQDVNNNYIHSHLPNNAAKTVSRNGSGQQQDTAKGNQQHAHIPQEQAATSGPAQIEQTVSQTGGTVSGQEHQPLIFAHQLTNVPLAGSSSSPVAPSLISLPSGLSVPEGTVVDQMIAHFSMNRQNESSAINLKLHPQELGELRMEIKVEQDNIKAHIIAQNPQAQEMIDKHLPRLREALEQQGLHLQEIEVTVAANDTAGDERFRENTGQQQQFPFTRNKAVQPVFTLETSAEFGETEQASSNLSVLV